MKKKNQEFCGHLPTGKLTTSIKRYVRAYRKLSKVMAGIWPEDAQFQIGYEPGVQMGRISLSDRQSIQLYEAVTGKKYVC